MDQLTLDALSKWKEHRYRPVEIPFADAVRSLGTDDELVEVRQSATRKSDWVFCRPGTSAPAIFVYAGVFSEADPYDTGNFVWGKAPVPDCLDEGRVARYPGYKAAYSYAIETFNDKEIWELQTFMDAHMQSVPGFNSREVKRREWQNGNTWHLRYWFQTPMFLTCEARGGRPDPPDGVHEWVAAAHRKSKTYRANPVHPTVCGLQDGRLELISNCVPPQLEYGDVVSLVFGITYVEDREDWGPVPMVSHVIRVQHANRDVYLLTSSLAAPDVDDEAGALPIGTVVDAEQAARADVRRGKRPEGERGTEAVAAALLPGDDVTGPETEGESFAEDDFGAPEDTTLLEGALDAPKEAVLADGLGDDFLVDDIAEESGEDVGFEEEPEEDLRARSGDGSTSEMDVDDEDTSMLSYVILEATPQDVERLDDNASGGSTITDGSGGEDFSSEPTSVVARKRKGRPVEEFGNDEVRPTARSLERMPRGGGKARRSGRIGK